MHNTKTIMESHTLTWGGRKKPNGAIFSSAVGTKYIAYWHVVKKTFGAPLVKGNTYAIRVKNNKTITHIRMTRGVRARVGRPEHDVAEMVRRRHVPERAKDPPQKEQIHVLSKQVSKLSESMALLMKQTVPDDLPPPLPVRCVVCEDTVDVDRGYSCGRGHATCQECFSGYILSRPEGVSVESKEDDYMPCPYHASGCEERITFQDMAAAASKDAFLNHMTRRTERQTNMIERKARETAEIKVQERIKRAMQQTEHGRQVEEIEDAILKHGGLFIDTCPECKTPFEHKDGCFALTCPRCRVHFCGCCLQSFGIRRNHDCHEHVKKCPKNLNPGSYYPKEGDWARLRRQRVVDKIKKAVQKDPMAILPYITSNDIIRTALQDDYKITVSVAGQLVDLTTQQVICNLIQAD